MTKRLSKLILLLALLIAAGFGSLTAYAEGTSPPSASQPNEAVQPLQPLQPIQPLQPPSVPSSAAVGTGTIPAATNGDQAQNNGGAQNGSDTNLVTGEQKSIGSSITDPLVNQQLNQLDLQNFDKFLNGIIQQYGEYLPPNVQGHFKDLLVQGQFGTLIKGVFSGLLRYLFHELFLNSKLLGTIIVLTVLAALLESMQNAFESNNVSKVAHWICFLVLMILAVQSFATATTFAKDAINSMVDFMIATIPLYLALLAATGGVASAAVIHPLIVFLIDVIGDLIQYLVFPLIFFSAILKLVSQISSRYQVTQLASLMKSTAVWVMGVFFTIFLGVVSVQGAAGAVADGVSIKAAKYVSSNFVPVVGKLFSDAADTVVGASLIVKNALGIGGVAILLLICAFPAIKILSLALIYNFSAAMLQPLGDSPIIRCLSTIGNSLILVFGALATVGFMFFMAVTVIIAAGNLSVMMR